MSDALESEDADDCGDREGWVSDEGQVARMMIYSGVLVSTQSLRQVEMLYLADKEPCLSSFAIQRAGWVKGG